jgi:hypothetical protein
VCVFSRFADSIVTVYIYIYINIYYIYIYRGVPQMGVPENGWFIMGHPNLKWMITEGTPISGNLHIYFIIFYFMLYFLFFNIFYMFIFYI